MTELCRQIPRPPPIRAPIHSIDGHGCPGSTELDGPSPLAPVADHLRAARKCHGRYHSSLTRDGRHGSIVAPPQRAQLVTPAWKEDRPLISARRVVSQSYVRSKYSGKYEVCWVPTWYVRLGTERCASISHHPTGGIPMDDASALWGRGLWRWPWLQRSSSHLKRPSG